MLAVVLVLPGAHTQAVQASGGKVLQADTRGRDHARNVANPRAATTRSKAQAKARAAARAKAKAKAKAKAAAKAKGARTAKAVPAAAVVPAPAAPLLPGPAPAPEPTSAPTPAPAHAAQLRFGFNEEYTWQPDPLRAAGRAADLGADTARIVIGWEHVQPSGPGTWDFTEDDALIAEFERRGVRPLLVLLKSPCWARPSTPCTANYSLPPDPGHDADWQAFATRVAARYPDALGIEVWNEQNQQAFWGPDLSAGRYVQLLRTAHTAIRSVSAVPVVSGGVAHFAETNADHVEDMEYVRQMHAAGLADVSDAVGDHPYPQNGHWDQRIIDQLSDLHRVGRTYGSDDPVWVTETGAESVQPGLDDATQAAALTAMVRGVRTLDFVPVLIVHRLYDNPRSWTGNDSYGMLRSDGSPKPAACVLAAAFPARPAPACR